MTGKALNAQYYAEHSDNEMVRLRDVVETLIYMTDEDSDGVEEVMQLPTIELPTWIPCKSDVPIKALEPVLVCNSKGQMTIACRMHDGKWGTQANIGEVVAWMPLPKPWIGADDE